MTPWQRERIAYAAGMLRACAPTSVYAEREQGKFIRTLNGLTGRDDIRAMLDAYMRGYERGQA